MTATSLRMVLAGAGLGTRRQAVPSQRSIRLPLGLATLPVKPTAHALRADAAATPTRKRLPAEAGLGTRRHAVPAQCMITVVPVWLVRVPAEPTAHALPAEVAATSFRRPWRPGSGPGARRHTVPFQRSISGALSPVKPTAQALRGEVAATLNR